MSTAETAAAEIAEKTGVASHDVAVVLGSGWATVADTLGISARIPYDEVTGMHPAGVPGHDGYVGSTVHAGHRVLLFSGRTHLYEGRGAEAVVQSVRIAAAAGCRSIILTNGAGSIHPQWPPGTPVLIRDHLNLTATSPLTGAQFVDLTDAYSPRLRQLARRVDPNLPEAVYAQFWGPQFETPAEVRMAATLGADLVGMSTALEAIAARAAGLEVLGLSVVTNLAAGLADTHIDHAELLSTVRVAGPRLAHLIIGILEEM